MKKIKFKRKSKSTFFSTHFFILIFIAIIVLTSTAYAVLNETLILTGTVNGQMVYTYYFEKPDTWTGSNMHAHIWINGGIGTNWPGLSMEYYATRNNKEIYKIDVTSDMAFYSGHNYIIFNDGSNQTINIPLDPSSHYNNLFTCGSATGKQILAFNRFNWWPGTKVYAYLWNASTGINNAAWPGVEITNNLISENLYAIEVTPNVYDHIIFNNGTNFTNSSDKKQTADLTINSTNDMRYDGSWHTIITGSWNDNFIIPASLSPSHSNN